MTGCWHGRTRRATHGFVDALHERGLEFSIGFAMDESVREAVLGLDSSAWSEAIRQDCEVREGAEVAEITADLDLSAWAGGDPGHRAT